jgi:hypothetical protein
LALEIDPTIVSPGKNPLGVTLLTKETLRIFVSKSQDLTLAVVPDLDPVTISLNK